MTGKEDQKGDKYQPQFNLDLEDAEDSIFRGGVVGNPTHQLIRNFPNAQISSFVLSKFI